MILYVFIMIFGNFVNVFGYQYYWYWVIIVVIGYICVGIQVVVFFSIVSIYVIDSYKLVVGFFMVVFIVNKNVWGYGMGKFIILWSVKLG